MRFIKALFVKSLVKQLARDNDRKTTVLGIVAAALLAAQLDWSRLVAGDAGEIGRAAGVAVAALFGYLTNKS